ncbi:unnamed protein product [Amoebophrya sp. A25]|nr:unnamed protein product [Amoebophrya sp. A25]|eukprot:GSA25T00017672001.1
MDVLVWADLALYDAEFEFRHFWLQSRMQEADWAKEVPFVYLNNNPRSGGGLSNQNNGTGNKGQGRGNRRRRGGGGRRAGASRNEMQVDNYFLSRNEGEVEHDNTESTAAGVMEVEEGPPHGPPHSEMIGPSLPPSMDGVEGGEEAPLAARLNEVDQHIKVKKPIKNLFRPSNSKDKDQQMTEDSMPAAAAAVDLNFYVPCRSGGSCLRCEVTRTVQKRNAIRP